MSMHKKCSTIKPHVEVNMEYIAGGNNTLYVETGICL